MHDRSVWRPYNRTKALGLRVKIIEKTTQKENKRKSLRELKKRLTRSHLEAATVRMLRRHGYRAMTVSQIVRAAGTTRTTFYKYFNGKSDLIYFLQESFIEPELVAMLVKLDGITNLSWRSLRDWVTDYAHTWSRIHLFLEAYNEALITDPEVAATAIPNTYRVTSGMTRTLSRFSGQERERAHEHLVILLCGLAQMLILSHAQRESAGASRLLDRFTDLVWEGFFKHLPKLTGGVAKRR